MFDRITWNPRQMNGQPCIRGMRLTVRRVVAAVAAYPDRNELFRNYPDLEEEDIRRRLNLPLRIWLTKLLRFPLPDRSPFPNLECRHLKTKTFCLSPERVAAS